MILRQSFFVQPVPHVVARERSLLAEAGLHVESRRTRSSGEQLEALRAGDRDVAVTALAHVFGWNALSAGVRIAAQVEQTTLLAVYARADITALEQLDGRRFAVDAATNGFALVARHLLAAVGARADFVEAGGVTERLEALIQGRADATLLGPPLDELAERAGLVRLTSANEALPALPGQAIVVRAERSEAETAALAAYLAALAAAVELAAGMTAEEGIALLEAHGFPSRSAAEAWRTRPRSLAVDADGFALIESLRSEAGALPPDYAGSAAFIDTTLSHRPRPGPG